MKVQAPGSLISSASDPTLLSMRLELWNMHDSTSIATTTGPLSTGPRGQCGFEVQVCICFLVALGQRPQGYPDRVQLIHQYLPNESAFKIANMLQTNTGSKYLHMAKQIF